MDPGDSALIPTETPRLVFRERVIVEIDVFEVKAATGYAGFKQIDSKQPAASVIRAAGEAQVISFAGSLKDERGRQLLQQLRAGRTVSQLE